MLKPLFSVACAMLIACASTSAFAVIDLTNFDDGTTQGWDATGSTVAVTSTTFDNAIHATTGDYALNLFMPPAAGFQWAMQLDNNDYPDLQNWIVSHPIVEADVSWTTSEWSTDPDGEWNRWDTISINSDAGWIQTSDSDMTDSGNPGAPGSWDPTNFGDSHHAYDQLGSEQLHCWKGSYDSKFRLLPIEHVGEFRRQVRHWQWLQLLD